MMEWAVTSSALIIAVAVLRLLFQGKISRRLQYALWGLVLLRLLIPFPLTGSPLSVVNWAPKAGKPAAANIPAPASMMPAPAAIAPGPDGAETANQAAPAELARETAGAPADKDALLPAARVFSGVWLAGSAVFGLWFAGANVIFAGKLRKTRKPFPASGCKLPVYLAEGLASPCLLGVLRPAVYLTPKALRSEDGLCHVLLHETCHYHHGDHIWSVLRGACLAVWWWNPLVWLAAILSRADSELACDEAVIRRLGEENRFAYGRTLVEMIAVRQPPSGLMHTATAMVSGSRGVKTRLALIAKKPKTFVPAMAAVILIAALCAGGTFTGAKAPPPPQDTPHPPDAAGESGSDPDRQEILSLVEQFGKALKMVSLTAPEDIAAESIAEHYSEYVTPELLALWQADPQSAPGRRVSSPWPDRIEVSGVEPANDGSYTVTGEIVEITSVEMENGGAAAKIPVTLQVVKRDGRWLISGVAAAAETGAAEYDNELFSFSLPEGWRAEGAPYDLRFIRSDETAGTLSLLGYDPEAPVSQFAGNHPVSLSTHSPRKSRGGGTGLHPKTL